MCSVVDGTCRAGLEPFFFQFTFFRLGFFWAAQTVLNRWYLTIIFDHLYLTIERAVPWMEQAGPGESRFAGVVALLANQTGLEL
jgi:hypothetical protein